MELCVLSTSNKLNRKKNLWVKKRNYFQYSKNTYLEVFFFIFVFKLKITKKDFNIQIRQKSIQFNYIAEINELFGSETFEAVDTDDLVIRLRFGVLTFSFSFPIDVSVTSKAFIEESTAAELSNS